MKSTLEMASNPLHISAEIHMITKAFRCSEVEESNGFKAFWEYMTFTKDKK